MTRVLSGVKPTADVPHLGNYIGAFRQWAKLQNGHEAYYCVVDLHSLTVDWDPKVMAARTRATAAAFIASGVDPRRSVLFVQSEVPAHTEVCWMLMSITKMGELHRMTQFKDAMARSKEGLGAGLFTYPVLMAADILAYKAHLVPVGDDQTQHVELCRDLAVRFNNRFGEVFPLPEVVKAEVGDRIMSLDDPTQKMDKSTERPNSLIWMDDGPDDVKKKISRAVTDSGSDVRSGPDKPAISNLLEIFSATSDRPVDEIEGEFRAGGYAKFKSALTDSVVSFLQPFKERFDEIVGDPAGLDALLEEGAQRATECAEETRSEVRSKFGLRK